MIRLDKLESLMQTEVNRKEFLKYVGVALLGLIGATTMLQNLNKALDHKKPGQKTQKSGYGATPYGR